MRKTLILIALVLLVSGAALAQDHPKAEVAAGYDYVRFMPGGGASGINCHGGGGSITVNANNWFGATAEFGGCKISASAGGGSAITYLFGPKIAYRGSSRATPFVEALFGGVHVSQPGASGLNGFAMAVGGGLDVKAGSHVAIRIAQGDYLMTRVSGTRQNNFRFSAGIVFLIGNK
jgi:hypothetical protein